MLSINEGLSYFQKFLPKQEEGDQSIDDQTNPRQTSHQRPGESGIETFNSTRFQASRKESQDITLMTEEGDKVTISALSLFQADYMAFDYSGQVKGESGALNSEKLNVSSSDVFKMSVEGDLNEEEQEDIANVLGKLSGIMDELISGDLESVMKDTVGILDDTDTISQLNATLQFHQQVSMEQQSIIRGPRLERNGNGRSSEEPPATDQSGLNGLMESANDIIAKITGQLTEIIESSDVDTEKLKEPVDQLFAKFFGKLDTENPADQLKSSLIDQIRNGLMDKLEPKETA